MVKTRNFDVELLLLRDDDIPEYVQDGICDLGLLELMKSLKRILR